MYDHEKHSDHPPQPCEVSRRITDFPSETFRVLKNREMKEYGEGRTDRVVPAAWYRLNTNGFIQTSRSSPKSKDIDAGFLVLNPMFAPKLGRRRRDHLSRGRGSAV